MIEQYNIMKKKNNIIKDNDEDTKSMFIPRIDIEIESEWYKLIYFYSGDNFTIKISKKK